MLNAIGNPVYLGDRLRRLEGRPQCSCEELFERAFPRDIWAGAGDGALMVGSDFGPIRLNDQSHCSH
jgi:hypothetical protein